MVSVFFFAIRLAKTESAKAHRVGSLMYSFRQYLVPGSAYGI